MRNYRVGHVVCTLVATIAIMDLPAAAISNLSVRSFSPHGMYIDFDLCEADGEGWLEVSATAGENSWRAVNVTGDIECTNGHHQIYWDTSRDGINCNVTNSSINVSFIAPEYYVIDLTSTPYSITYLEKAPPSWSAEYKTTKMVLRRIPAGTFQMGSSSREIGRNTDEDLHSVTISRPFYIGVFEVTEKQWGLIKGSGSLDASEKPLPIDSVSYVSIRGWDELWPSSNEVADDSFMGKLRGRTGIEFDLPTEAQWEYACRAGTSTSLNSGMDITNLGYDTYMMQVGRYAFNSGEEGTYTDNKGGYAKGKTTVGSYIPNNWGLYDMHGNAREWCLDLYQERLGYVAVSDPKGAAFESNHCHVLKGGGWKDYAYLCRSASRKKSAYTVGSGGFRVTCPPVARQQSR